MRARHALAGWALLTVLLACWSPAGAQTGTPQDVLLQGYLTDRSGGTPLPAEGTYAMTFALFDAAVGGLQVATAGPLPVEVVGGLYEVHLPFPAEAFNGPARFIEVTVGGETLQPRIRLTSMPYAYVARQADLLDGYEGAELEESDEITTAISDHTVQADAHREHDSLEESAEIVSSIATHSASPSAHPGYLQVAGDTMTGTLVLDPVGQDALVTTNGRVGIGVVPTAPLEVAGTVKATAFVGDGSQLTGIGSGGSSVQTQVADCAVLDTAGSYVLTANLPGTGGLLAGGDCLQLAASGITLDLGGYRIAGAGAGAAVTDAGTPLSDLTIRFGSLTGFVDGVNLRASTGVLVEGIRATGNIGDGIAVGPQGVLLYNLATGNANGLVAGCPANAVGNSAWSNGAQNLLLMGPGICTPPLNFNNTACGSNIGQTCTVGQGSCQAVGVYICNADSTDTVCSATPGTASTEICDGLDNNCDGQVDEGCTGCAPGLADCSGVCTDTGIDEANCGTCGHTCSPGEVCTGGVCTLSCQIGLSNCGGVCADTSTDEAHCGSCGVSCGPGEACVSGSCILSCQTELSNCGGICVNLDTDETNCGACGNTCTAGDSCVSGTCTLTCPGGPSPEVCDGLDNNCDGQIDEPYVDLGTVCQVSTGACQAYGVRVCSPAGTGTECSAMPGEPGTETCDGFDNDCNGVNDDVADPPLCALQQGVCAGATATCGGTLGWLSCNSADYGPDYESVELSCDGLDNDCDGLVDNIASPPPCASQAGVCAGTVKTCGGVAGWLDCTDSSYGPDYEAIELSCDSLDNDCDAQVDEGCGACDPNPDPGQFQECTPGVCYDLWQDEDHCGTCGHACAPAELCIGATCTLQCQTGLSNCSGVCVSLNSDEDNCGACGINCASGESCESGSCTLSCQAGLSDCGGICVNTATDEDNCGACGVTCGSAERCESGACQQVCPPGLTACGGACVDTQYDDNNCGACGVACGELESCQDGVCESLL